MTTHCLVLTPWMHPHQAVSWQEAVTLVYLKKGDVVEEYDAVISSPSVTIKVPAVVRLKRMLARVKTDVKFSRVNVYTRDGFRCQYCGLQRTMKHLNYDHVVPRSLGGRTTWENIVTSCIKCNLRKDCRTPEQAGMRLLKKPVKPKSLPLSGTFVPPKELPDVWAPYLGVGTMEEAG
jgi:5-methylcytosine-specific restriction endonuclease McrA